jgi:hypothetical protein
MDREKEKLEERREKRWEEVKEGEYPIELFAIDLEIERSFDRWEKHKEQKRKGYRRSSFYTWLEDLFFLLGFIFWSLCFLNSWILKFPFLETLFLSTLGTTFIFAILGVHRYYKIKRIHQNIRRVIEQ